MAVPLVLAAVRRRIAGRALTIRTNLLRHPAIRALVGLIVGFGAASVTFLAVDRYGTDHDDDQTTIVIHDDLDYDGFCATVRDGGRVMRISEEETGWRCGGFVEGVWSPTMLDFDRLCEWQFGANATPRENDTNHVSGMVCTVPE